MSDSLKSEGVSENSVTSTEKLRHISSDMAHRLGTSHNEDDSNFYEVNDSDISNKYGNYIFTVGNVSSGKSTLQNLLVYRLWSREDVIFNYSSKDGDHRHDAILEQWVKNLMEGKLPERSKAGVLQEFNISFSQARKKRLDLNFLELSGEDIKTIVPGYDRDLKPGLNSKLEKYLSISKSIVNKRFILVSDSSENKKNRTVPGVIPEDILFYNFIKHMLGQSGLNIKRLSILFVAAKWDSVKNEYSNINQYFKKNFPQTRSLLKSNRCNVTYLGFTVGKIETIKDSQNGHEERISSLESKPVDFLIQWIYTTFTGTSLDNFPRFTFSAWDKLRRLIGGKH